MATKFTARKNVPALFSATRIRHAFAAIACTASLSTVATVTPAVAQDNGNALRQLSDALDADSPSVASLAAAIAKAQSEVARLESEMGSYREAVNQALMELQDARTKAAQARGGVEAARGELGDANSKLSEAQDRLNEISRTAYRRANTSDAVTNVAGGDARNTMLERQAYLRTQAEEQQGTVNELEKVRTQKANKESQLRLARDLAEAREESAIEAESNARVTLEESQAALEELEASRSELVAQEEQAQVRLNEARGIDDSEIDTADADVQIEERHTSDSVTTDRNASGIDSAALGAAMEAIAQGSSNAPAASRSAEAAAINGDAPVEDSADNAEGSAGFGPALEAASSQVAGSGQGNDAAAEGTPQGSSDAETIATIAGAAVAAAAVVGQSQPNHAQFESGDLATSSVSTLQNIVSILGDNSSAAEGSTTDSQLEDQLQDVLPDVETVDSVTEDAAQEVADLGRSQKIEAVIARAQSQVGVPYAWGGGDANGPTRGIRDGGVADRHGDYNKVGFDCSGLVLYAFAGAGIALPHFTGAQYNHGTKVNPNEMERGDLIFYGPSGNHHVAIYLGDGMMIEAPQSGQNVSVVPVRWGGMAPHAVRLI